jgi:Uma2 family endonuclease
LKTSSESPGIRNTGVMTQPAQSHDPRISEDEYLRLELLSDIRHEYIDGYVHAMSGVSRNHARIAGNLYASLLKHLRNSPCEPFASNFKLKAGTNYLCPDVMVVCDDDRADAYYTQAPVIIVEVLSKSTRRLDETPRRMVYQNLPSLLELVWIEPGSVDVEICRRREGWVSRHYFLGDKLSLESIGLTLPVATLYERVDNDDARAYRNGQWRPADTLGDGVTP